MPRSRALPTLIYHDIFDYPLTEGELEKWEMRGGPPRPTGVRVEAGKVHKTKGYYHLHGRSSIVKLREKRKKESAKKLKLARKISTKLSTISTIEFIGVTGSLAMNNAKRESDIDLMIITSRDSLWTTRVAVKIAALIHGFIVRGAGAGEAKNAVCFNLWLDEKNLAIPRKMRNLYSAHEILQVMPLYNRDHTFEKFLDANKWALDFWPKAKPRDKQQEIRDKSFKIQKLIAYCFLLIASLFEPIAYFSQKAYMYKRITRELVEPGRAFFHPIDWGTYVISEFSKRVHAS